MIELSSGEFFHGRCFIKDHGLDALLELPFEKVSRLTLGDVGSDVMIKILDKLERKTTKTHKPHYYIVNGKIYRTLTGFKNYLLRLNPVAVDIKQERENFYWISKKGAELHIPSAKMIHTDGDA